MYYRAWYAGQPFNFPMAGNTVQFMHNFFVLIFQVMTDPLAFFAKRVMEAGHTGVLLNFSNQRFVVCRNYCGFTVDLFSQFAVQVPGIFVAVHATKRRVVSFLLYHFSTNFAKLGYQHAPLIAPYRQFFVSVAAGSREQWFGRFLGCK